MEAASEGEKKKPAPEGGEPRSKRQMKTALQLEILEKTYAGLYFYLLFFYHSSSV